MPLAMLIEPGREEPVMTDCRPCGSLLVALGFSAFAFLAGTDASAADRPAAADTPAILASLNARDVTVLDDAAAGAVRGQGSDYRYVLVRILGLNTLDFAPGIDWTWNPFGYRYGAWGGPGWTNGGNLAGLVEPADAMDTLFKGHDLGTLTDQQLVFFLSLLPNVNNSFWGQIYVPNVINPAADLPVGTNVWVSGASFIGGKFFFGWRPMPFTEYSRRQALTGMQLLVLLP
jgi:hypothetical protein